VHARIDYQPHKCKHEHHDDGANFVQIAAPVSRS
jgi:hypothetical protein